MARRRRDSDSSDFSESDVSIDLGRYRSHTRKHSLSRRNHSPDPRLFLSPGVAVHRSASTGGRRSRKGADPATVVVDIKNDVRSRQAHRDRREDKYPGGVVVVDKDTRDSRPHRASSPIPSSRTPSPFPRDWELLVDQRIMEKDQRTIEKNEMRQDLELFKQQQEIERLERLLAKDRDRRESRDRHESREQLYREQQYREQYREAQARARELERERETRLRELERERIRELERERERERERGREREREWEQERHSREPQEVRGLVHVIKEDDSYDEVLNERLRMLEKAEKKKKAEEERKEGRVLAEYQEKAKKLDEMERKSAEEEQAKRLVREQQFRELEKREREKAERDRVLKELKDEESRQRLLEQERKERERAERERVFKELRDEEARQRLLEQERKERERAERERVLKELKDEEARRRLKEQEQKSEEDKLKKNAIEEYKKQEEARKLKEIRDKEKKEQDFREHLRSLGYSEQQAEEIITKNTSKGKEKKTEANKVKEGEQAVDSSKTVYIKVHRKYLLPETLNSFRLPWDWDERDGNYIIIKTWIPEDFQEQLFEHTRRLREGRLITETSSTTTELKVNDRKRDKMYLVRKKSPSGRAWLLT